MEMVLSNNFYVIDNNTLELIDGGHQSLEALALLFVGAGMMAIGAPILCALAGGAAATFFLAWTSGAALTLIGAWWYNA